MAGTSPEQPQAVQGLPESARMGQRAVACPCAHMNGIAHKGGRKKNLCQWTGGDTFWRRPPRFRLSFQGRRPRSGSTLKKVGVLRVDYLKIRAAKWLQGERASPVTTNEVTGKDRSDTSPDRNHV